jgi:hypothetical protein
MRWYQRSFSGLSVGDEVEFFPVGVDPNVNLGVEPRWGGPVEVRTDPSKPGPLDGGQNGLMVRAGRDAFRVRSDQYEAWYRQGGYKTSDLR